MSTEATTPQPQQAIPNFTGELTVVFPETNATIIFKPRQLLRQTEDKWSFPCPDIPADYSVAKLCDLFGSQFIKELIVEGITDLCQSKWRQTKGEADPVAKFKVSFFEKRRALGMTSVKMGKLADAKFKDYSKALRAKNKAEASALYAEWSALNDKMLALVMEEMAKGLKPEDLERMEKEEELQGK